MATDRSQRRGAYPAAVSAPHAHTGAQPHAHAHDHRSASRRALVSVLVLTLAFTIVEIAGGLWTGSLALLADAGHMVSDAFAIGLALVAITLARTPDDVPPELRIPAR